MAAPSGSVRLRHVRAVVVTVALAALLLAACSGDDDSAATTQEQATTTEPTTTEPTTTEASDAREGPGAFLLRVNEYVRKGQLRRAWLLLHPAQQKAVRASTLASCFGQTQWPPNAKLKVTETYREPWDIPGGPRDAPSTAVTIQVYVQYSEEGSDITSVLETFTQHAFQVSRRTPSPSGLGELERWAWILSRDTFETAKTEDC